MCCQVNDGVSQVLLQRGFTQVVLHAKAVDEALPRVSSFLLRSKYGRQGDIMHLKESMQGICSAYRRMGRKACRLANLCTVTYDVCHMAQLSSRRRKDHGSHTLSLPSTRKDASWACRSGSAAAKVAAMSLARAAVMTPPRASRAALKLSHSSARSERKPGPHATTQLSAKCLITRSNWPFTRQAPTQSICIMKHPKVHPANGW